MGARAANIAALGRLALGGELREATDSLLALGEQLARELDGEGADLVQRALRAMRCETCQISVIGQVKGGKTSLLNALIRRPKLLPTADVPWTAVVTRAHFGFPEGPNSGATFTFFDEAEWTRLAEGGGRLRELAETLLPNFNQGELQRQLEQMRSNVSRRLGDDLGGYLGKAHHFEEASPELIARYVAAEASAGATERQHFADITRSADLYFDLDSRGFPLTLIDAPGTNDPFLVREEITLRMIEDAEACVVLVSAHEPMGLSDLGLLRLLRGLRKERLLLFVNRIDEVDDLPDRAEALRQRIRNVLAAELPGTRVPIVLGSARWANLALSGDSSRLAPTEVDRLIAYATRLLAPDEDEKENWLRRSGDAEFRQGLMLRCSGLADLELNLSWLMSRGRASHYAHQASATFATVAESVEMGIRGDLEDMRRQKENALDQSRLVEAERNRADRERKRLNSIAERLNELCRRSMSDLDQVGPSLRSSLEASLRKEIYAFARNERARLLERLEGGGGGERVYRCDTSPLHQRISEVFVREYRWARQGLVNTQRITAIRMRHLLMEALPDIEIDLDFAAIGSSFVYPPLAPLGQALAFDLEQKWWQQWWRRRREPVVTAGALEQLILHEFLPVAQKLVGTATEQLSEQVDSAKWRISLSGRKAQQTIEHLALRLGALRAPDTDELIGVETARGASRDSGTSSTAPLSERISALEVRLEACARLKRKLQTLTTRLEGLLR
ncbi:MAG: hypothetical protein GC150_12345 [Rhizobiales bacterium]|nr:hypothetical protein [Hyphomicrobiales bacterium]